MGKYTECINGSWTTLHLLDIDTKKTPCGMVWHKAKNRRRQKVDKNEVWIPVAMYFNAGKKCKVCFKKGRHA